MARAKDSTLEDVLNRSGRCLSFEFGRNFCSDSWLGRDYFKILSCAFERYSDSKRLRGVRLVDLGAGAYVSGIAFAQNFGVKDYVAIEPYNFESAQSHLKRFMENNTRLSAKVVKSDMLSFLKKQPADSLSLMMFRIDLAVLPDDAYREKVAEQIARTLSPNGIYLTDDNSVQLQDSKTSNGIKKVEFNNHIWRAYLKDK